MKASYSLHLHYYLIARVHPKQSHSTYQKVYCCFLWLVFGGVVDVVVVGAIVVGGAASGADEAVHSNTAAAEVGSASAGAFAVGEATSVDAGDSEAVSAVLLTKSWLHCWAMVLVVVRAKALIVAAEKAVTEAAAAGSCCGHCAHCGSLGQLPTAKLVH